MGKFSDQIRDAIQASGTTRYSLAKQVGIPESALSRFMRGKQGLTLATLDKLADLLGLEIVTSIQRVQRPAPVGRKRKEKPMRVQLTKAEWQDLAKAAARDASENHFPSRRGVWHFSDTDVLCFYNNNPYAADPKLRDEEVAEFRKRLKAARVKELAYATYPGPGEPDAGYTFAMIVDARRDQEATLSAWWVEIIEASFMRLAKK
jgi:transcriptional regulator with XRE-family HTH domain